MAARGDGIVPTPRPPTAFCQMPSATSMMALPSNTRWLGSGTKCRTPGARSTLQSVYSSSAFDLSALGRKRRRPRALSTLRCELTRLSGDAGNKVLPVLATSDQWAHYWGGTEMQRVGKFFEVSAIAFLGLWACYFTSFFLGVGTTSIIGAAFLFYWLLAPNISAYRRNRSLRGRIARFPDEGGNSVAIFSARVASATEEYHPVTGQPVFLRMVIEDGEGRALKFRTRTRAEYARIRPGMIAEAVLVSPDDAFEEIVGVSDTYIPGANVWVGEYPYIDKVVMLRLLANRESKRRRRSGTSSLYQEGNGEDEFAELDTNTYYDALRSKQEEEELRRLGVDTNDRAEPEVPLAPTVSSSSVSEYYDEGYSSEYDYDAEESDEPQYEGWGSAGFTSQSRSAQQGRSAYVTSDGGGGVVDGPRLTQRWERVSGKSKPRPVLRGVRRDRRPPPSAGSMRDEGTYGSDARERWRKDGTRMSDAAGVRERGRRR